MVFFHTTLSTVFEVRFLTSSSLKNLSLSSPANQGISLTFPRKTPSSSGPSSTYFEGISTEAAARLY